MSHLSFNEFFTTTFMSESAQGPSMGEDFSLCDNGNIVFHWADYHETCDSLKNAIELDSDLKEEYRKKELGLNRLNMIPVWIRTEKKVHQCTMFDLYEKYVLNDLQLSLGLDPFGPIEISFISSTGPFRTMSIAECFNKSTYKDFVMIYLLKGKLPRRDFRIRLKAKVLIEYGPDFSQAGLINIEQLTMNGLLLSLDADFYFKNLSKEHDMNILIDSSGLDIDQSKGLEELKSHLSQYVFNLMYSSRREDAILCDIKDFQIQSSFDFFKNKKVYLFISYSKLSSRSGRHIEIIQNFVSYARELVKAHYKFEKTAKSA
jgi:hypothetical protein